MSKRFFSHGAQAWEATVQINACRSTAVTGSQTGGGSSGSGNGATGSSDGGSGASSAQNVLDEFQRQLANLPA